MKLNAEPWALDMGSCGYPETIDVIAVLLIEITII